LRDVFECAADLLRLGLAAQVADRDDADQALLGVDDRQTADLLVAHVLEHLADVLVLAAALHAGGHHVAGGALIDTVAVGDRADHDVTVGDHAEQLTAFCHGHRTDVLVPHDASDVGQARVGGHRRHVSGHHVTDLFGHVCSSLAGCDEWGRPAGRRAASAGPRRRSNDEA
jgi:hypothetical protein